MQLQQLGNARKISKTDMLVKALTFVLKAEPLEAIETGCFGASSFHREMLQISKLDKVTLSLASVKDLNPLSEVSIIIDYKLIKRDAEMEIEEDGQTLKLNEDMITEVVAKNFKNRFINTYERFAMPIYEGKCVLICYVDKITPIGVKSTQSYGLIEGDDQTDIMCKAKNPKVLKIATKRMQEK